MKFIPAPYVGHREAWRRAYLSIYGPMANDEKLTAAHIEHRREQREKLEIFLGIVTIEKSVKVRKFARVEGGIGFSSVPGKNLQEILDAEKKLASLKTETVEFARNSDPVPYLFNDNNLWIPPIRFLTTRNLLLQKLFDKEIVGYWLKDGPTGISDNKYWTSERGPAALTNGTVVFHRDELKKAFPPNNAMSQGQIKQGPGQPKKFERVALLIEQELGDGWEKRMSVKEAFYKVQDAAPDDLDVKKTTFDKARKLIADRNSKN